jgi:hypothetical protein
MKAQPRYCRRPSQPTLHESRLAARLCCHHPPRFAFNPCFPTFLLEPAFMERPRLIGAKILRKHLTFGHDHCGTVIRCSRSCSWLAVRSSGQTKRCSTAVWDVVQTRGQYQLMYQSLGPPPNIWRTFANLGCNMHDQDQKQMSSCALADPIHSGYILAVLSTPQH